MSAGSCCRFQRVQATEGDNKQRYETQSMYLYECIWLCVCTCVHQCVLTCKHAFSRKSSSRFFQCPSSSESKQKYNGTACENQNKCKRFQIISEWTPRVGFATGMAEVNGMQMFPNQHICLAISVYLLGLDLRCIRFLQRWVSDQENLILHALFSRPAAGR